ncbi:MAG TPA: chitobiase/beta-hexosaminidase C-terminal domain-containing protein, partial [Candidatus Wallbacteria bacterium]|nr:chitobiase/beta-hexosaminidase C-terminal domain-containing protein [Candidatus Wallbacteria bacterium]
MSAVDYAQKIPLADGFNFISFTVAPAITPAEMKALNPFVEDIYQFSPAAGSFLGLGDGTLTTLAAYKGYIVKSRGIQTLYVNGSDLSTAATVNLKAGFNLVGFSRVPEKIKFTQLMARYGNIGGIYQWSANAGTFIQMIRDGEGRVVQLDSVDPTLMPARSYFIKMNSDATLDYSGPAVLVSRDSNAEAEPVTATLEVNGELPPLPEAPAAGPRSYMVDYSGGQYSLAVVDAENNSLEIGTVTVNGNSFKATLDITDTPRNAMVVVKQKKTGRILYRNLIGRTPVKNELPRGAQKIVVNDIVLNEKTTAQAILASEMKVTLPPMVEISASTPTGATIAASRNPDVEYAISSAVGEGNIIELAKAVRTVFSVITSSQISDTAREKILSNNSNLASASEIIGSFVAAAGDEEAKKLAAREKLDTSITLFLNEIKAGASVDKIDASIKKEANKPRVETPVITPAGGRFADAVQTVISCPTAGAEIYYTLDNSRPARETAVRYSGPFAINANATVKAAAFKADMKDSQMASEKYYINAKAPMFVPPDGEYKAGQSVAITSATPGAEIYYTLDGGRPPAVLRHRVYNKF